MKNYIGEFMSFFVKKLSKMKYELLHDWLHFPIFSTAIYLFGFVSLPIRQQMFQEEQAVIDQAHIC